MTGTLIPSGIKSFIGKKMSTEVKFMGEKLKIYKLSVQQVEEIQAAAKITETDPTKNFEVMKTVITLSVEGGKDLTDDDFKDFALDELNQLAEAIMKFSGIGKDAGK